MLPKQDTTPTFNEILRMGIRVDEIGMPQEWSSLIHNPPAIDLQRTSELLANVENDKSQHRLECLAHGDLSLIGQFFSTCPELTFFFVAWDRDLSIVHQHAGPSSDRVMSMLCGAPKPSATRGRTAKLSMDTEACNRTWQAIQVVTEALETRDDCSFSLLWQLSDQDVPDLKFSSDFDRQVAWRGVRLSLPLECRQDVPATPPSHPQVIHHPPIEPAPPSKLEPDPALCSGVAWHRLQQINFDREPAWRWSRAWSLVRHGRFISRKRDDADTGSAVRFLRQLVKHPQDVDQLTREFPSLFAAHDLRTEDRDRSLELECRLLSRQSSAEIAQRLSISADAVDAYCKLFYDIRGRLDSRTYIVKKLLGVRGGVDDHSQTAEGLLKSIAYFGGPAVFDAVLGCLGEHSRGLPTDTTATPPLNPLLERFELLADAINLPSDAKTSSQLLKALPELFVESPITGPTQRWMGVLSQITKPYEGEVTPPENTEPASGEINCEAA